jgi:hypothetical protein
MNEISYPYKEIRVDLPESQSGDWKIERFEVSDDQAKLDRVRSMFSFSGGGRSTPAGKYTRLMRNGTVVMSDTPDEIHDFNQSIPYGDSIDKVHFNGLGLGISLDVLLKMGETKEIVVVEKSKDVIDLVGDYYLAKAKEHGVKLHIHNDDAFTWKWQKGTRYNWVWHDIWDYICADNLSEMTKLKRRFGRMTDSQNCWCEYECRRR